jgi:2,4-dienoyl-CoA reductase-like NADH-dependent reductase (Old Yellow Enzyme family)
MSMWRPPERIRHDPQPGPWPTAGEAAASLLFSPLQIGAMRLHTRTWVPAMVPWRAGESGEVTQDVLDWYERFARGRPGALVVEATGIRDVPSGPLLRIGDDRFLPGLRRLVEVVREASGGETRLLIQIIDFLAIRRRPDRSRYLGEFLRLTDAHRTALGLAGASDADVRARLTGLSEDELHAVLSARELEALTHGKRERVTDLHLPQVRDLPRTLPPAFAAAARRAREAGFDGVELHYAHAYTMASFLSATNDRTDGYGGTREARARLPLEVLAAVRHEVGTDWVVGCRMLAEECIDGGSTVADAEHYAVRFAQAGMDFISLSRGGKFDDARQPPVGQPAYPYTGRSGYECMPSRYSDAQGPFGRNFPAAARVRAAIRAAGAATPVVTAGGLHGYAQAEAMLRRGEGDVAGFARAALADPDWFQKVRLGLGGDVRLCRYTNYCEALDQRHRTVTCELWDREALGPGVAMSADGKRRLLAPPWSPPE